MSLEETQELLISNYNDLWRGQNRFQGQWRHLGNTMLHIKKCCSCLFTLSTKSTYFKPIPHNKVIFMCLAALLVVFLIHLVPSSTPATTPAVTPLFNNSFSSLYVVCLLVTTAISNWISLTLYTQLSIHEGTPKGQTDGLVDHCLLWDPVINIALWTAI